MSVLPAGQPLGRYLPDLDELVRDPRAYLAESPVTVGPRQMYGLAALFGFVGAVLLLSCAATGAADGERLALGVGLLLGGGVWLGWSLMLRGHSLVLRPDGVEVNYHDTTVWVPWAVFNVDGQAFVPDADNPRVGLTLPVAAEAVPFVELRRDDTPVAHGAEVRARQWYLVSPNTVVLPARYEVVAGELGELLLLLGRKLGRDLPRGTPPPEAYPTSTPDDVPSAPDSGGWISVHLTRLAFPPRCCDCGEPTGRTMNFAISSRWDTAMSVLVSPGQPLELPVPVCEACQAGIRERQRRGGVRGLQAGALLACAAAVLLALNQGWGDAPLLLVLGGGALAVGGLAGFLLGTFAARRPPVELGGYSPSRGTLAIRFRRPEYAAEVLAAMRARDLRKN